MRGLPTKRLHMLLSQAAVIALVAALAFQGVTCGTCRLPMQCAQMTSAQAMPHCHQVQGGSTAEKLQQGSCDSCGKTVANVFPAASFDVSTQHAVVVLAPLALPAGPSALAHPAGQTFSSLASQQRTQTIVLRI